MKRQVKIALWVAVTAGGLIAACAAAAILFSGPVLKWHLVRVASRDFGVTVTLDSCRLNPFAAHLWMSGLRVHSPPGFTQPVMLSVPELEVDLEWWRSLRARAPQFRTLVVNVSEFAFERRPDGVSNWDRLLGAAGAAGGLPVTLPDLQGTGTTPAGGASSEFVIDNMRVSLGRIRFSDPQNPLLQDVDVDAGLRNHEMGGVKGRDALTMELLNGILPAVVAGQVGADGVNETLPPPPAAGKRGTAP